MMSAVAGAGRKTTGRKTNPQVVEERPVVKVEKKSAGGSLLTRTFANEDLEQSFLEFCQMTMADCELHLGPVVLCRRLQSQPIEWIDNPHFALDGSESILGERLLDFGDASGKTKFSKVPDLPPHLARLCETKLLKPTEEQDLFQRLNYLRYRAQNLLASLNPATATSWDVLRVLALLKAADWHRDCVVKANMRLVISIVKKFVNANNAFDDLLSDGIVALMRAVDKFDYDRGFRFSTYATQVVRRNAYRMVVQKQRERLKIVGSLQENGLDISDEDRAPTIDEHKWHELRSRLALLMDNLDRREKLIIRARFSLGGHRTVQTLQRLADKLGVSKERVRQLEKRALDKLRGMADEMQFAELSPPEE
jgi:RNA polymerase primary sigma factor